MGLTANYATAIYDWLNKIAPTYREPITSDMFTPQNPKPNEYISYMSSVSNFGVPFIQAISIYSKSTGYRKLMAIVDEIEKTIGENGAKIINEWGTMTIYKGSPFYQDKAESDTSYRAGYINLEITVYQKNV